jgi:hypothetical protein
LSHAYIAVVPEYPDFDFPLLMSVAAALQKQVQRDVAPAWHVRATVNAFARLGDVPIDYWPLVITNRDLGGQDGTHLDDQGKPYALVESRPDWSLLASHECIEMILDPFGARTIAGPSPLADQGRVEFLLEACDPCQSAETAYAVNGILVSDFVTPAYYEPTTNERARYSFSGEMKGPRTLLPGGYLSWRDPVTEHWWQKEMTDASSVRCTDLGTLDAASRGHRSAREVINATTQHHRYVRGRAPGANRQQQARTTECRRASSARAVALHRHVSTLPALSAPQPGRTFAAALAAPPESAPRPLDEEIRRAIQVVQSAAANLPDRDRVLATLNAALDAWTKERANNEAKGHVGDALIHPESPELSLVRSAIRTPQVAPGRASLTGHDIIGFSQYEDLDPRWIATVWNRIFRSVVPFPVASTNAVVHPLQRTCTIALASDWGTGDDSSKAIAEQIRKLKPTYTIHLGDVYYSGTASEETQNMLVLWPTGTVASFALNSNHEMYSGGHGLLEVTLTSEKFETQGPYTYFALVNDDWVILGLDSAHEATAFYQNGKLNQPQLDWIQALQSGGVFTNGTTRKGIIVLTHHQAIELDGTVDHQLWDPLTAALAPLGGGPDYWYWGHLHAAAVFQPVPAGGRPVRARLIGHGGIPYVADPTTAALEWSEEGNAGDPKIPQRSLNGFAVLHLDGPNLREELIAENGEVRWHS